METIGNVLADQEITEIDLTKFQEAESTSQSRTNNGAGAGAMSIVYSSCGKRCSWPEEVMARLNHPKTLRFSFSDTSVAISEGLPNHDKSFTLKKSGAKYIVYSAPLVDEFIKRFNLVFSGRTSLTFYDVKYATSEGLPVAVITLK